jgi:hypothetical protein|tara:strand:+ start:167 stop:358 length:192 start_codon:yes stop_codon:yes gene_type:complete
MAKLIFRTHPHTFPFLDHQEGEKIIRTEIPPGFGGRISHGYRGYDKHYHEDVTNQPNAFNQVL